MNRICRASVVIFLIIAGIMALFPETICASGSCDSLLEPSVDNIRDAETEVILENEMIICRVDVKAGQDITSFYEDGQDDCYMVEGIGTNSVTISEIGNCKNMSNVQGFSLPPTAVTFVGVDTQNNQTLVILVSLAGMVLIALVGITYLKKGGK